MRKYSYISESGNFIFDLRDDKLFEIQLPTKIEQRDYLDVNQCRKSERTILDINIQALEFFLLGDFYSIEIKKLFKTWVMNFTPFFDSIYRQVINITPGMTLSYKEVAKLAGNPNAFRAVGSAMRRNRYPLLIPCHRVIGSDGNIGGYSGANGITSKIKLINWEKKAVKSPSKNRFIF